MRKHWKKLALILGCSMLLVGQVPVRVYAEEAQVADVKAKLDTPTNVKWSGKSITFEHQNEQVLLYFQMFKDGQPIGNGLGRGNQGHTIPKGRYSEDHKNFIEKHGYGNYTFKVKVATKDGWESDWSAESDVLSYNGNYKQLPQPVVEVDSNGLVKASVPGDSHTLGVDYSFEYTLYASSNGRPIIIEQVWTDSATHQFSFDAGQHWVGVKAVSKNSQTINDSDLCSLVSISGSSSETSNSSGDGCSHNYEWETVTEATDTQDGREAYRCTRCGHVKAHMEVANSAYAQFNKNAIASIDRAPLNGTVTLRTNMWVSFYDDVIETLKGRPDVTVVVKYFYEGTHYAMTIPAGADLSALAESEGYYGFRYLDTFFPGKVE